MRSLYYGKDLRGSHYIAAVYDNMIKYFDAKKPFLNPSLTISEVAKAICTNKVYVSEAIKLGGKKNFNYLLNEYRIKYALELFQKNPGLRVNELAYKSGFNSPTSFTMAFKMIVNIPPGEWCRRYKMVSGIDTGPSQSQLMEEKMLNRKNRSG